MHVRLFAVDLRQDSSDHLAAHCGRQRPAPCQIEALPEPSRWPLVASAEQGPAYTPFIVLSKGQCERGENEKALLREFGHRGGKLVRPIDIPGQMSPAELVATLTDGNRHQVLNGLGADGEQPRC